MATVLRDISAMEREIAELKAKLAQAQAPKALTLKVTEKGAISIYGLQRFPVTLYASQWERIGKAWPSIQAFMVENKARLASKD